MTMSKGISADQLTAYEKWELPVVQDEISDAEAKRLSASQAESIRQAAYDEGFTEGKKDGLAAAENEIAPQREMIDGLLKYLSQPLTELDDNLTLQLAELSMAVARQVIRRELQTDTGEIVAVVREAISVLPAGTRKIVISLHPEDAEIIRNVFSLSRDVAQHDDSRWIISEDPVLTRGGCHISSEHSNIDATIETRLNRVITTLLGGERESDI